MNHFEVEVCQIQKPVGLLSIEVLGKMKEGKVFVVSKDLDGERGAMEVMPPGF